MTADSRFFAAQPSITTPFNPADEAAIDARARETEAKMTDDERFALIISLMGAVPSIGARATSVSLTPSRT